MRGSGALISAFVIVALGGLGAGCARDLVEQHDVNGDGKVDFRDERWTEPLTPLPPPAPDFDVALQAHLDEQRPPCDDSAGRHH